MDNRTANPEESAQNFYPIGTVSNLTGVNAVTLRAWERRYQLFQPIRKASGHRLYTQDHIDRITRVVGLLDRGMRIGQVKASLDQESTRKNAKAQGAQDSWSRGISHMLAAIIRFDEAALEETYSSALALHPTNDVTDKLLIPLLAELGRRWEQNEGSIAEEHFFGFYLRNKLGARFHHRARNPNGPRLLMACLPGEMHETGLLLAALAAGEMGYKTILLGADMPLAELPSVVRKSGCDGVILSTMMSPSSSVLDEGLTDLVSELDVPLFLGGRISVPLHEQLQKIGIHSLGANVTSGLQKVRELLPHR